MSTQDILSVLLKQVESIARSETVVGEPIQAGDATIVPVSHIAIGFGVGGGGLDGELPTARSTKGKFDASATGGGISVDPVAFIVVTKDGRAQLLPLKGGSSQIARVIDMVPEVLDRVFPGKTKQLPKKAGKQDSEDE